MKTAVILVTDKQGGFKSWGGALKFLFNEQPSVLILGFPEGLEKEANALQKRDLRGTKVIQAPYKEDIMTIYNSLQGLLGDETYDEIYTYGVDNPKIYLNSSDFYAVSNPKEALAIRKANAKAKEEQVQKEKGTDQKAKEKPEPTKEKEKPKAAKKLSAPPGQKKKEKREQKKEERKEKEKADQKQKEKGKEKGKEKEKEKQEEKQEQEKEKEKEEKEEKEEKKKEDESKEKETKTTFIFDPFARENFEYLYPKSYTKTAKKTPEMKEWKARWFGEQVYVSKLALMRTAWVMCNVFGVDEISSDDVLQIVQLVMRCRSFEDYNSSVLNVLSRDGKDKSKLIFSQPSNISAIKFRQLSQVASWYTALCRLLTEQID